MFRCSRDFFVETTQKVVFHLLFSRIFRKLFLNGRQKKTSLYDRSWETEKNFEHPGSTALEENR